MHRPHPTPPATPATPAIRAVTRRAAGALAAPRSSSAAAMAALLLAAALCLAARPAAAVQCPMACTSEEIAKMARGGMADFEIAKFCRPAERPAPGSSGSSEVSGLREKWAALEGVNWRTHFLVKSGAGQASETVFFSVGDDAIAVTSSNPAASYFGFEYLPDALRFKRRQPPYTAVYTYTLRHADASPAQLLLTEEYKQSRVRTWTPK